jgi:phosphoenolpyruvate carboxykinase (GTP)
LENIDPNWDDPQGHIIKGILYGGRDTDTNVPISEAKSWEHGVYIGATIESETTSATLGRAGLRQSNPMAIMDFMVIPFGLYLKNHINFGNRLKNTPKIFSTNYFLQNKEGKYLNRKVDKKIWIFWSEGRVHEDYDAIKTPLGYIPIYNDLKDLFGEVFDREFTYNEYLEQFSIRVDKYLEKQERMEKLYGNEQEMPEEFWKVHYDIKRKLEKINNETGKNIIPPSFFQ